MSGKWIPGDDELDALARTLPVAERASERVEQERTGLLAQAAASTQRRRGGRVPYVAGALVACAAAAAVLVWVIARPGGAAAKASITALGPAQYERTSAWPDFVVRLDDGKLDVRVAKLAGDERFRVVTDDAEVEVRGTQFVVGAVHGAIASVAVAAGRVEVRWAHEPAVFLAAGETWSPPRTAQRDVIEPRGGGSAAGAGMQPASPPVAAQIAAQTGEAQAEPQVAQSTALHAAQLGPRDLRTVAPAAQSTALHAEQPGPRDLAPQATQRAVPAAATHAAETAAPPTTPQHVATTSSVGDAAGSKTRVPVTPAPPAALPGEADFRAGIAALRVGDAKAATASFASACKAAAKEALGEDACFWLGAAAKRAGQTDVAREALARFLASYPRSARAGEASALLGWLLYDAGEFDAAEQRFEAAAHDRVAKVKQSAQRGLEAIKRTRAKR